MRISRSIAVGHLQPVAARLNFGLREWWYCKENLWLQLLIDLSGAGGFHC